MRPQSHWIRGIEKWVLWVIITGFGWPVGLIFSKGLTVVALPTISDAGEQFVSLVIGGIVIALAQIIYLSPDVRGRGFWVMVSSLGWVSGAMVTWLFGLAGDFFFQYGWLFAGLIGGMLHGGFLTVGFQPWDLSPFSRMSQVAVGWITAYTLGVLLLGREMYFHLTEFLFISWAVLGLIVLMFNLVLYPNPRGYRPAD